MTLRTSVLTLALASALLSPTYATLRVASRRNSLPKSSVAVVVVGDVDRYLPRPTIDHLVGSAVKSGLEVDYYAALAGDDAPGLKKDVAAWLSDVKGHLASFSIAPAPGGIAGSNATAFLQKSWHRGSSKRLAAVWSEVKAQETASGKKYSQVMLVREDAYWFGEPAELWHLNQSQAYFRACANDGTPAVVYALPRSEADEFLGGYAGFLSGDDVVVHVNSTVKFTMPAEMFLLEQAEKQGMALEGLQSQQLPVLPAGRSSRTGFEDACAVPCYTEGCDAPDFLPACAVVDEVLSMSRRAPCLDGSNRCYSSKQRLSPEEALKLYQLTHMVDVLLSRHGVWHFASGGTLLGAVRNKGIIPHDDDSDFNILRSPGSFVVKSSAFKADLEANGLYLAPVHADFWKVKNPNALCAVDLFATVWVNDRMTYANNMWPGPSWPRSITYAGGLVRWTFGSTTVPAPSHDVTHTYLDAKFGKGWATEVSCKGGYHQCSQVADTHYDLTGRAMPDSPLIEPV